MEEENKTIVKGQSEKDLAFIKNYVLSNAKNVTDDEFKLLMYMANQYQLDVLTKQIWLVKFGEKAQIYAGRNGFLAIAHRSPHFDGMSHKTKIIPAPIRISYRDGNQTKIMEREFMYEATCLVHRKDMRHPFQVTVTEDEYSTGRDLWFKKPKTMLVKVAESQALRRAFDISGLYADEEFNHRAEQFQEEENLETLTTDARIAKLADISEIKVWMSGGEDIEYVRHLAKEKNFNSKEILEHMKGRNTIEAETNE